MSNPIRVKICGVTSQQSMRDIYDAGAQYIGLVFFDKSPRNVTFEQAQAISQAAPRDLVKVALTVDPDNGFLERLVNTVPLDMIQLHGRETPQRVSEIKQKTGMKVMKAIGLAEPEDLKTIDRYEGVADQIMVDAKPMEDATLPGGNGFAFDWNILKEKRWSTPWMLAGGLNPDNIAQAVKITGARQIDVSSGVEASPGKKDREKINAFIKAAQTADFLTA